MAGKISSFASGTQSHIGARASATISTNTRVRTTRGFVGLVTDAVIFPAGTGLWFLPNQRVRVNNMPTLGSATGISVNADQSVGTMMVVEGDVRVDGM
jgi:hypothetical protein